MKRNQKQQQDRVQKEKFVRTQFPVLTPKNDKQKKLFDDLKYSSVVVAHGSAGTGKAQPLESPVLSRLGWVTIGSLKVGDEVMGSKGWVTVTGVFPQGIKDVVEVKFRDGAIVECCTEHLWTVLDNTGKYRKSRAVEVTITATEIAEKLKSNKGNISVPVMSAPAEFSEKDVYISPYVIGALIGDGSFGESVTITSVDEQILERFRKELPEGTFLGGSKGISYYVNDSESTWKVRNRLKEEIAALGLKGTYSNSKFIPSLYKQGSADQRWNLIQGLMDTDGTVCKKTGSASYCTVSKQLALDVREVILSLGGKASITTAEKYFTYKGEKKKGQLAYIVSINVPDKSKLFCLDRKKNLVANTDDTQLRRLISSVENIGQKECVCISVDSEDHLYVTNDCVLTHNTIVACYHAARKLHFGDIKKIILIRAYQPLAGRTTGFLPGTIEEKLQPYYRQMLDYFEDCLGKATVEIALKTGTIEICSLETIRGRSWADSIVIVDEGQNLYVQEVQALMTRIGDNCQMIICGDDSGVQTDVRKGMDGLTYLKKLSERYVIDDCSFTEFKPEDCLRSGITKQFVLAFEAEYNLDKVGKGLVKENK